MTVAHPDPVRKKSVSPEARLLVSQEDAATLCSVSVPTFKLFVDAGLIVPVEMPLGIKRKLFRRADLNAFIESLEVSA